MKRLIIFSAVLLMGLCFAPEPVEAQTESGGAVFIAGRYDKFEGEDGGKYGFSFGVAKRITGPIWAFPSLDFGQEETSLNTEFGTVFSLGTKGWFAFMAGPNVDWQEIEQQALADQISAYLSGAGGLIAGYNFNEKWGLSAFGKYNFKLDEETQTLFKSGWTASVAMHFFVQ